MAPSNDLKALQDLIVSTLALLKQFSAALTDSSTTTIEDPPNPLHVLRDAATLLKAHTTKISLLAINKPFTPTAVSKVLRDISGTCLPALLSAAQITTQQSSTYGSLMPKEVSTRVRKSYRELENLLSEISSISRGNDNGATKARDSLASTGVVWESCDSLIALSEKGISGLALQKAEQYRESIKDAIAELQEWKEGTDTSFEGPSDELLGSDDEGVGGDELDELDDLFNAANSLPKDRPELKALVEEAEGKLKKVVFLYTALGKRRFKTYSAETGGVETLDEVVNKLNDIQESVDELVSKFYDLDEDGVKEQMEATIAMAKNTAQIVRLSWKRQEDEFTAWSKKWEEALG